MWTYLFAFIKCAYIFLPHTYIHTYIHTCPPYTSVVFTQRLYSFLYSYNTS